MGVPVETMAPWWTQGPDDPEPVYDLDKLPVVEILSAMEVIYPHEDPMRRMARATTILFPHGKSKNARRIRALCRN